jgi:hypothetical protein
VPRISRRSLLTAAVLAPLALVVDDVVDSAARGATLAASLLRPSRTGSSGGRCGSCGAADHSMLDPRCPSAPRMARGRR